MKTKSILSILPLAILIWLSSCQIIYFDDPQPAGSSDLSSFPGDFQGSWHLDNDTFRIGDNFIQNTEIREAKTSRNDIDPMEMYLIDDTLFKITEGGPVAYHVYRLEDDTLYARRIETEYFFLSDSMRLRKARESLILNFEMEDAKWLPISLSRDKNGVLLMVMNEDELPLIRKTLQEEGDSLGEHIYIFRNDFSARQITKFIAGGGFSDTLIFLPAKNRITEQN